MVNNVKIRHRVLHKTVGSEVNISHQRNTFFFTVGVEPVVCYGGMYVVHRCRLAGCCFFSTE